MAILQRLRGVKQLASHPTAHTRRSRGSQDPQVHCPATAVLSLCFVAPQISRNPERVGTACPCIFLTTRPLHNLFPVPGALFPSHIIRHLHMAVLL